MTSNYDLAKPPAGREDVVVSFDLADLRVLDAWIAEQDIPFTRDEAVRAIVAATLQLMKNPS
jgi:hypothetical protein